MGGGGVGGGMCSDGKGRDSENPDHIQVKLMATLG